MSKPRLTAPRIRSDVDALSSMERRITLRDVAAKAGVHFSTVSLALRGDRKLAAETRDRICQIAAAMGYKPDPMLAALNAYRRSVTPPSFQGTLGWVTNFSTAEGWRSRPQYCDYFAGAEERAEQLGYKLAPVWLREPGLRPERTARVLQARSIQGLILCPQPQPLTEIKFPFETFSAVTFGFSLVSPRLNLVASHQFNSAVTICRELRARGYRRIGFAVDTGMDWRVNHNWSGGFWSEWRQWPAAEQVPFLQPVGELTEDDFVAWFEAHHPDVIVADRPRALPWLERMGLRVPDDVGHALLSKPHADDEHSGIDENSRRLGAVAVETVVSMIQHGTCGVPELPQHMLLAGRWFAGTTVRPQRQRATASAEK